MLQQLNSASYLKSISRHFKSFPVPDIFLSDSLEFLGQYFWPNDHEEVCHIGEELTEVPPIPNGALILGSDFDEGTLLHEYRHHLQYCVKGDYWYTDFSKLEGPEYFEHDSEEDACVFELTLAGCYSSKLFADMGEIRSGSRSDLLSYIPIVAGAWWL